MNDTFGITVIFIVIATGVAAFVRRIRRDKCLKDFEDFLVTLEETGGSSDQGRLHVENTGMALTYVHLKDSSEGHPRRSRLVYKSEYGALYALIRYHDELSEANREKRAQDLERTYHPGFRRRLRRRTLNVFKTIRDSISEVVSLLLAQVKKSPGAGKMLAGQDKYVGQMQKEALDVVGTSYEPLLEPYIGHQVLLEITAREQRRELRGILKDYSADFIEVMDVNYTMIPDETARIADLIIPRAHGVVRHLAE
ncbi:hypothetical protein ACFL6U_33185 [Planctomycetota bacterium]